MSASSHPPLTAEEERVWRRFVFETEFYARNCAKIVTKGSELEAVRPRPAQLVLEAALERQRLAGRPERAIVLKSRQTGISTWVQIKMMQRASLRANRRALVVAQDNDTAAGLFDIGKQVYQHLPPDVDGRLKPEMKNFRDSDDVRLIHFGTRARGARNIGDVGINSWLRIDTAKESDAGRGKTFTDLHLCLTPDTPVLLGDGRIVPVSAATIGDRVVTHTGQAARITAITGRAPDERNGGGVTVKVTPWLGGPIEMTPNHPVWTERGWVPAGDLTLADRVSMPVRAVTSGTRRLVLPDAPVRSQGGGRRSVGAGAVVELTEETGFAFGYYLAEGSLGRNVGLASSVTFARHRDEAPYADRAVDALEGLFTSRAIRDVPDCLTTTETIYGSPLARLLEREFGTKAGKRVPDWVFDAGEDFLRGLLAGYLSGDGSKTNGKQGDYTLPVVTATSISSSIPPQMRDIAASLGYGWGSIRTIAAGPRGGRNCQAAWSVGWYGSAARALRRLVGLEVAPGGRERTEKAEIRDGMVWMKIRKLAEGHADLVYDVEVDHADHSFRTLHMAVKNSEMAFWPNQGKALSLLNAVPDLPGTLIVIESTANGTNEFRKRWDRAYAGDGDYAPVFISWLIDPDCRRGFSNREDREDFEAQVGEGPYGADEPGLVDLGATAEQLHWRRTAITDKCDGDTAKFKQEYPSHPGEAFLGSGNHVFSFSYIERVLRRVEATDPPRGEPGVLPLLGDGLFIPAAVTTKSVRDGTVEVPTGTLWVPREATGFDARKDWWRVWEHPFTARMAEAASTVAEPVVAGQYVVACDVAGGDEMTSGEKSAWHAIQVVNHLTLEQCAEWRSRCDPDFLPLELFLVASYFNEATVVVETTGSWGGPVVTALHRRLGYRQIYRRQVKGHREERPQDMLGWDTNRRTKPYLETAFREQLREGTDGVRSKGLGLELSTYVRDARGNSGPDEDAFSDRLMAYMIAQFVAHERRPRPPKRKREPGAGWTPRNPVTGW